MQNNKLILALALVFAACGPKSQRNTSAVEKSLPSWMEKGDEVRLALAEHLIDNDNTYAASDIIKTMRQEGLEGPELDLLQGRLMRKEGVTSEAERLLSQAADKLNKDARPYSELCILWADDLKTEEAIGACQTSAHYDDKNAGNWNNLGFLLLADSQFPEAVEALQKAVELDGTNARYRNNLGLAQAANGRPAVALHTLQSILGRADAAYNVAVAIERFSESKEELKKSGSALKYYQLALKLEPDHTGAQEGLSRLEAAMGEKQ